MKIFKATVDTQTKPYSLAFKAKTYALAEIKAHEAFVKMGLIPAGGFFLLNQVKKKG